MGMEEIYREMLEKSGTAICVRDIQTDEICYVNRKAREIFQIEGDIRSRKCYGVLHHENEKCRDCPERKENAAGNWKREIYYHKRYYLAEQKQIDWDGRAAGVVYYTDITEKKMVLEQLKKSKEEIRKRYQYELNYRDKNLKENLLTMSRLNLTCWVVEEMQVGTEGGYEKEYRHVMEFEERAKAYASKIWLTEEQKQKLSPWGLLRLFRDGVETFSEEYIAETYEGRHIWVKMEVNLLKRPDTAEVVAFLYSHDVTMESKLKQILEHVMAYEYDEIYTIDIETTTFDAVLIGQYAPRQQITQGRYEDELRLLIDRTDVIEEKERIQRELSLEALCEYLSKETAYETELSLLSKGGGKRLKQIRCMYLNRKIKTLLLTLSDIEDVVKEEKIKQQRLEEALRMAEDANRAKTNFLSTMSHEIRTPMNAIIGLNAIIREEIDSKDQIIDCTKKLETASGYLLSLLNDILDMSRIENGNVVLLHQPFAAKSFWENVNTIAKAQALPAGVDYQFEWIGNQNEIYVGDATRMEQIMINLINNAIKFTSKNGSVKVKVIEEESGDLLDLLVIVSDNGIGIAKDFIPKIFDAFTQQHEGNTTEYGGSGLGLSIARSYVRMMGGDIHVTSEEGKGTTFVANMLLDKEMEKQPEEKEKREQKEITFEGKRVLLAEDHPLNTMVATRLLEKRGMEVVHAENGQEAVEIFEKSPENYFDAVLMDIRMPIMDGMEAARRIRRLKRMDAKFVPVIAMTANAYEEDRKQTREAGMVAHLAKPIDPNLLYETLDYFL